jgi:hypothetical protein
MAEKLTTKENNIKVAVDGDILVLRIDLSKNFGKSKSGKSVIVASSKGNKEVVDGFILGLNIYTKNNKHVEDDEE